MSGQITRKEIIEDEALKWGEQYVKMLEPAIAKNKEFVESILALNEANKKVRASSNDKEYIANSKAANELANKSIEIWKEQIQLENALISTKKKNELVYESTNKALVKERTLLAEANKEIKLQVRNQLGLVGSYEKLNRARLEAQKRLAELESAEKRNTFEIARARVEFEKLDARVKAVDAAIKNYSKNIGNYQSAFNGLNNTARELMATFGVVTGLALFGTIVKDIFNVVKDFDRQLIAVGKTTNMSKEDLKAFGREVVELGGKLDGISIEGLLKSAEVAGQLGVTGTDNILKFSSAIEKLKLTSDIISDEQVGQFAKFIEVSQDSFDNADKLASVITRLGNELATTEAEVLANATEIQKGVSVYNANAESVLGLAAATSTLGNEAEVSASSIQKGFGVINNAIATGKNLDQVLKLTNLSQKELSKQFNADAAGTFVKFVGGLKKAKDEGQNLQVVLKSVELDEVRTFKTIGSLAANYGVLEQAMKSAKEEYIANVALNKEVAAASESVASILTDIKDKWQQYILTTNDANGGTASLARGLKFLRDNLQAIISGIIKYGSVFLVFLGVQKAVNFATASWIALQTAATAAQIRFALATGIGTKSILAQAEAARAAMIAQEGLNVAVKATPWGLILGFLSAAVVAYMVFNDTLSSTEQIQKRINDVLADQKSRSDESKKANEEFFQSQLKNVEDEYALKRARQGDSDKLNKEEIAAKKKIANSNIELNEMQIEANTKLLNEIKVNSAEKLKVLEQEALKAREIADKNTGYGYRIDAENKEKAFADLKVQSQISMNALRLDNTQRLEENKTFSKTLTDLKNQENIKNAEIQAEADKKAIAAAKKRARELYELEKKRADDEYKLAQFRLQVAIDLNNEILTNEEEHFINRYNALLEFQQLTDAKNKETAINELKNLGYYDDEKRRFIRELSDFQISEIIRTGSTNKKLTDAQQLIYEKYQNELTKTAKKGETERLKLIDGQVSIIQKSIDAENQAIDTAYNNRIVSANNLYKSALDAAKDNFELIEQATEEHENRLREITLEASKEKIKNNLSALETILENNKKEEQSKQLSAKKVAEIENEISAFKKELSEIELDNDALKNAKLIENAKLREQAIKQILDESADRQKQLQENLTDAIIGLTNAIFDAKIASIDNDIQASNDYYDNQIDLAGNDARQKDLLEKEKERKAKELEKQRKKEMVKAAIFNKAISLAQVGIDLAKTLSAIQLAARMLDTISFGTAGLPYQGLQTGLAFGVAAAQTAAILATPLPKYKGGRLDGPAEWAWTGDGYRKEVVSDPDGSNPIITPAFPTLTYLKEHQVVHKSVDDYQKFVRSSTLKQYDKTANEVKQFNFVQNHTGHDQEIIDELKRNTKAIEKNKGTTIIQNTIDFGYELWRLSNINWNK